MEDAASLAVVLPKGTQPEDVVERLRLYESFRYKRANNLQEYSRIAGRDLGENGLDSKFPMHRSNLSKADDADKNK